MWSVLYWGAAGGGLWGDRDREARVRRQEKARGSGRGGPREKTGEAGGEGRTPDLFYFHPRGSRHLTYVQKKSARET